MLQLSIECETGYDFWFRVYDSELNLSVEVYDVAQYSSG